MGLEIERKFLVTSDAWRTAADTGVVLQQGYLCREPGRTVRVRLAGDRAWLTIKGVTVGIARPEYEYSIPPADAAELLTLCEPVIIAKTRYRVPHAGHTWEVDVFAAENEGLVLAEVELDHEDAEVEPPSWVGEEVSAERRYHNSQLSRHPFTSW